MNNLYYTLATLPHLEPGSPPPFATLDEFWVYVSHVPAEWRTWYEQEEPTVEPLAAYRSWDRSLRSALGRLRGESLGWRDQLSNLPSLGGEWGGKAWEILSSGSPLEVEVRLDRLRFEVVDDLVADRSFDQACFFGYVLKLDLLLRQGLLERERGQNAFDRLHASVLETTDLNIPVGEQT